MISNASNLHDAEQRIVVTGMGILAPGGRDVQEFASLLQSGGTGIRQHSHLFEDQGVWAGLVADYDPLDHFSAEEVDSIDRTAQMGYIAARQAVVDAGLDLSHVSERTALTLGTSHGGRSQLDRFVLEGSDANTPEVPRRLLVTAAHFQQTSAVASKLGVHGPTATLSNACSSSGAAITYAIELLRSRKCDYGIAGGADGFSRLTFSGFSALGAVADGPCAPFSELLGMSLGDGAAFVVLETLASARRRQAKVYAELWGYGLSWDAYHITAPEPSGDGMNRAIRMAVSSAGIEASRIEYVNVHGTGTRCNDLAETVGLQRFFDGTPPPVSATKSQTGHMLGASSAVGLISCILGMNDDWLPPTANFAAPRAGCEIDVVPNQARKQKWSCFMAQSAAFAGANAVLVGGVVSGVRQRPVGNEDEEIVISGIGVVSPLGCGFKRWATALAADESGITPVDDFEMLDDGCQRAGRVRDYNPRKLMPSLNLRRVDRVAAYATIAASLALQHADRWPLQNRGDATGLVVGLCRGAAGSYERYLDSIKGCNWDKASAVYFPQLVMSSVGGQVSASLGIKGITSSLVGSAAGLQALIHGWELFRRNPTQEAVIVLAADELASLYFGLHDRDGRLARGDSRFAPGAPDSHGMLLGEGAVALVLERVSGVRQRGGTVYGALRGSGLTSDAAAGGCEASGRWLSRAYEQALEHAGLEAAAVSTIYGSAQGRPCYDQREQRALETIFGTERPVKHINQYTGVAEATSSLFQVAAAVADAHNLVSPRHSVLISASGDDGANAALVMEVGKAS
jgi:3-oxoacyl-[acyl-carrier-protein] synthase II